MSARNRELLQQHIGRNILSVPKFADIDFVINSRSTHWLLYYTGWPKKVSHYDESSLNRIKTRH